MALPLNPVKLVLFILSIAGFYGTWVLLMNNGTAEQMAHIRDHGPHWLPGTKEPPRRLYIGIAPIDYQLTILAVFFWKVVDGSMPNGSLLAFHLAGQFGAAWTIVVLEGLRKGHRGRVISYTMVLGLLIQNLAYAVITPLYLILHLSTSPTTISPSPADISVDIFNLISIPISITIGYVLPAVLLALPAPSVLTFGRKQILMAIWQVFPISVDLLQRIIPVISSTILKGTDKRPTPPTSRAMGYIRAMRGVYLFALILSGFTHISAMTLTATSKFFSGLFAPEYVGIFNPSRVFFPRTISTATQMPSIGHGTLMLLQYDGLIGSASLLIWASALFVRAYGRRRIFDRWLSLVAANVLLTGLMGPVGCVVALIWARDELLLSGSEVYAEKSM